MIQMMIMILSYFYIYKNIDLFNLEVHDMD